METLFSSEKKSDSTSAYNVTFTNKDSYIGINQPDPQYSVDILSSTINGFRVQSTTDSLFSVLSQNNKNNGIAIQVKDQEKKPVFYNKTNILPVESSINVSSLGDVTLFSPTNVIINSPSMQYGISADNRLYVPNTNYTVFDSREEEKNEFGITESTNEYENEKSPLMKSNALHLIANKARMTGIDMGDSNGNGLFIAGGSSKRDSSRSKSVLRLYNQTQHSKINNLFFCENSRDKYKNEFMLGINTTSINPSSDFTVHVNGAMRIGHSEITVVYDKKVQKLNAFYFAKDKEYRRYGLCVNTTPESEQIITYTTYGGQSWKSSTTIIEGSLVFKIRCAYVYDDRISFIGGEFGLLLYSKDGFQTYTKIDGLFINTPITAIEFFHYKTDTVSLYICCIIYNKNKIAYFTLATLDSLLYVPPNTTFQLSTVSNTYSDGRSLFYSEKPDISIMSQSRIAQQTVKKIHCNSFRKEIYILGEYAITNLLINTENSANIFTYRNTERSFICSAMTSTPITEEITFCVGTNRIIILNNKSSQITTVPFVNAEFTDVYANSLLDAVAVAKGGEIYYTNDTFSWNKVDATVIFSSGLDYYFFSNTTHFSHVTMTDDNTYLFLSETQNQDQPYTMFSCYFPQLLNNNRQEIMNIQGNVTLGGDMNVQKDTLIGRKLTVMGNSTMNNDLIVNQDITCNKLLTDLIISRTTDTIQIGSYTSKIDIFGNLKIETSSCRVNSSQTIIDQNLDVNGFLRTSKIHCVNKELVIGGDHDGIGGKTIRISENSRDGNPNNVFIGASGDNVTINGNNLVIQGSLSTITNQIQLRSGSRTMGDSASSGIFIRDYDDDESGFIKLNSLMDGYLFKSSRVNSNVLNMHVNELITGKIDVSSNTPIQNALVILKKINPLLNLTTMTTANFDVQNIIIGNYIANENDPLSQTITTKMNFVDNVVLGKSLSVVKGNLDAKNIIVSNVLFSPTSFLTNTSLLGNTVATGSFFSVQTNTFQFSGNEFVIESPTRITGNIILKGNLINEKKTTLTDLHIQGTFVADSESVTITNAATIGKTLNVVGILTSTKIVIENPTAEETIIASATSALTNKESSITMKKNFVHGSSFLSLKNIIQIAPIPSILFTRDDSPHETRSNTFRIRLNGGFKEYTISASAGSLSSFYYNTFNELLGLTIPSASYWIGINYRASDGLVNSSFTTTSIDNILVYGEYLEIKVPYTSAIVYYKITPNPNDSYGIPCS